MKKKLKVLSFTYIGNLPKNFKFNASQQIKPLHGLELAEELKKHNIYLTASKNEPSETITLKVPSVVFQFFI